MITTKFRLTMNLATFIEILLLFILSHNQRRSTVLAQADPTSCRKQVECFVCDSREIPDCEDAKYFSEARIPIQMCDDYCLKVWTRENDTIVGDNKTMALRYVRRGCYKIYQYHIKKAETCYKHKKHRSDSLCLCGSDRCNSSVHSRKQRTIWAFIFASVFLYFLL